jgi:hypothetical protein
MRSNREPGDSDRIRLVAQIECRDGFHISVQGHYGAYCSPRQNDADFYSGVECGFPSAQVPELAKYKDGDKENRETDTEAVYGYVPARVVADLLNKHGGIKGPYVYPEKTDG